MFWYLVPSTVLSKPREVIFVFFLVPLSLTGLVIAHDDWILKKKRRHVVGQWPGCLQCVLQCLGKSLGLNFKLIWLRDLCIYPPFFCGHNSTVCMDVWRWAGAWALRCAKSWNRKKKRKKSKQKKECLQVLSRKKWGNYFTYEEKRWKPQVYAKWLRKISNHCGSQVTLKLF